MGVSFHPRRGYSFFSIVECFALTDFRVPIQYEAFGNHFSASQKMALSSSTTARNSARAIKTLFYASRMMEARHGVKNLLSRVMTW